MDERIEVEILSWIVFGILGYLSFEFSTRFLQNRSSFGISRWILIFIAGEVFISRVNDWIFPYNSFVSIFPLALLIFMLQRSFFAPDLPRQIFLIVNFVAAWEILRFMASSIASMIFLAWNPIFEYFALQCQSIEFLEEILWLNRIVVFGVLILSRATQLGILAIYLRFISRQFPHEHDLTLQDSKLLALPCVAVLVVDLTIRLIAFSAENGAAQLIYDRVPSIMILLPLASLLLLGVLASHVVLFRSLTRRLQLEIQARGMRHDLRDKLATVTAYVRARSPDAELESRIEAIAQIDHEFPSSIDPRDVKIIRESFRSRSEIQIRSFMRGKIFCLDLSSKSEIEIDSSIYSVVEKYDGEIESSLNRVTLMLVTN